MAAALNILLGNYAQSIALIINGHELSKQVKEIIRDKMVELTSKLGEISEGEVSVLHTGLQYSHFHMIRLLASEFTEVKFFPCVEFDLVLVYERYKVLDCTSENKDDMIQNEKCFGVMFPSAYPGYTYLCITDHGRKMIDRPSCDVNKHILPGGYLPNYVFRANWFPEFAKSADELYNMLKKKYEEPLKEANDENDQESLGITHDFAHTFPVPRWPRAAKAWQTRSRPTNWPSADTIKDICKGGCLLVPTGYPASVDKDREWRLSFNMHEQRLAKSWNITQKTCYAMVLMMLKTDSSPSSILTPYLIKNTMFWFCELQYGPEEFDTNTLGDRILQLLYYLRTSLKNRYLPNYFIAEFNLVGHLADRDVEKAYLEVNNVLTQPFWTITKLCHKLDLFDVRNSDTGFIGDSELHHMLVLYATFVQNLYRLGFDKSKKVPSLAGSCFQHIITMNKNGKPLLRTSANGYQAENIVELLVPLCQGFAEAGDLDKALSFYLIMYNFEKDLLLSKYPDKFVNMACIYNCLYDLSVDKKDKKFYEEKALEFFKLGEKYIPDSPMLRVGYGKFLVGTRRSVREAIIQFKKAISIENVDDCNSLIQIDVPGWSALQPAHRSRIPSKMAGFLILASILVDIDQKYEARRTANKMEELAQDLDIDTKPKVLQMCAMAYDKIGLFEKAFVLLTEAFTLYKRTRKLLACAKKDLIPDDVLKMQRDYADIVDRRAKKNK